MLDFCASVRACARPVSQSVCKTPWHKKFKLSANNSRWSKQAAYRQHAHQVTSATSV